MRTAMTRTAATHTDTTNTDTTNTDSTHTGATRASSPRTGTSPGAGDDGPAGSATRTGRGRPAPGWWLLAALGVVAVLAATGWTVATIAQLGQTVSDWERAAVPGPVEVTVEEPGTRVVRAESPSGIATWSPDRDLDVAVSGPDRAPVAVHEVGMPIGYRLLGRGGQAVATFTADEPGRYRVTVDGPPGAAEELSVGEPLWHEATAPLLGAALLGAGGLGATVAGGVGILAGRPHSRSREARTSFARTERTRLASYALLALGLSWAVWVPALLLLGDGAVPVVMLGAFGPAVAAGIMVRREGGSIRHWLRRLAVVRLSARWYVAALTIPLVEPAVTTTVAVLDGATLDLGELAARLPLVLGGFVVVMLVGGGQEELGWRGWLLPRLQDGASPLVASLALGALWAVWHLPLFLLDMPGYADGGMPFGLYLPLVMALSTAFTWLFNRTGGSVVAVMVLHAAVNSWDGLAPLPEAHQLGSAAETIAQAGVLAAYVVVAAVLVAATRGRLGAHSTGAPSIRVTTTQVPVTRGDEPR